MPPRDPRDLWPARQVRDRLLAFCDWCAAREDIPGLITLAATISRWEDQIVTAVLTGVTSARSESLNRIACTRGTRRRSPTAATSRGQAVTRQQPDPG